MAYGLDYKAPYSPEIPRGCLEGELKINYVPPPLEGSLLLHSLGLKAAILCFPAIIFRECRNPQMWSLRPKVFGDFLGFNIKAHVLSNSHLLECAF